MQKVLISILMFFYSLTILGQSIDCRKIVDSSGISYLEGNDTPFTGHCVQHNSKGKIEYEGSYTNGIASGLHRWYYRSGKPKEEVNYIVQGKGSFIEGAWKEWFENGNLKTVINYKNGYLNGEWFEYNKYGKILKHGWYKDNKLLKGNPIKPGLK